MSWDPVWEEIFRSRSWGKYPAEELVKFVARNFFQSPDRSVVKLLEIGCGPGGNCWFLAREGFQTYGVDGSPTAISQAIERLGRECPGWKGELKVGDFLALDYPSESIDAFIDNEAVCCNSYESSKLAYKEAARVLRRGGRFFVRTFAVGSYGYGTGKHVGYNAFKCSEGPLVGLGYARFTSYEDIRGLFCEELVIDSCETIACTHNDRAHIVEEWIITGHKK
jgi:SAM-dependent methyltransferase